MKNPSHLCALCLSCACLSAGEDAGASFVEAFASSATRVVLADGSDAPAALVLERRADGVFRRWTLVNRTDRTLRVREIVLADAAHGLPPETGFYGEGCQMLSQTAGTLGRMVDLDHYTDRGHYRLPEPEGYRTAYGLVTLSPPGGGHAMAAFTSCRRFAGKFNVNAARIQAVIDAEGCAIEPSERWDLEETVWARGPDRDELLALLAARIVANHGRPAFPALPAGWCSWYCFGPAIDREKIRGNCEAIRARIPELRFVQIDDGYQPAMGDWIETGPAFGGGVQDVLRTIREAGLEPAIWVAPFVASPGSKLFAEHPEWFVKDAEGRPLRSDRVMFGGWRLGPWYVLDGTHPEAQRHLAQLFRTMREEWGCTYFKLDATFWGMIRGGRFHDERATGVEAYRRGMEAIRRGAGDAFLLGCNHPIWASFGLIHGSRSSMDVGKSWGGFAGTARENLMRAWQNDRLWWNDPDSVVLDTKEPAAVRDFHTAAIYATGGMVLSGDDLRNAAPEKLAVLRALAANPGKAARFQSMDLEVGWIDEAGRRVLILLNWSNEPARREAALAAPARVRDLFSGEDLGVRKERVVIEAMPPRSGRVLVVEPAAGARRTISLDGAWQIAEGGLDDRPATFDRTVPVPGLVDMAEPPFVEPGPKVADRRSGAQRDPRRDAFWYRRTFVLPELGGGAARLKIHKAMFGARAWLNGKDLGVHMPCFTPGIFDVREAFRAGENEIVIRVGASRDQIPPSQPDGFDYEKSRYIPGIFDRVELILAGEPFIENVQVAPDIGRRGARIRVRLSRGGAPVSLRVREAASGREVGRAEAGATGAAAEAFVPIEGCRLWSPDDPFLYELVVRTTGDEFSTRFGMREIRTKDGRVWLNGKVCYLRGNNITLYRFFEDEARGALPWDETWVRALHEHVKDMHWNALRYCIGFPPELWYRIADETGILIQDEFPIWGNANDLSADQLACEYREWMEERWNHPCVVIWDAQNETVCAQTGEALGRVRALDMSDRPWDNGWSPAQAPGDVKESHPYWFSNPAARLSRLATRSGVPGVRPADDGAGRAVIINEYDWLWINRDGSATTLTRGFYDGLLGADATAAQRREIHARYTAAMTEFWRMRRGCAGVLHFTTLGYDRPDGQTCDYFIDVARLTPEPMFHALVRDAFAPVGVGIDFFAERAAIGTASRVPVAVVNDLHEPKDVTVILRLRAGEKEAEIGRAKVRVEPLAVASTTFEVAWPASPGECVLVATLEREGADVVRSVRHVAVGVPPPPSLALGRAVTASSVHDDAYAPENAVDGNEETYWSSAFRDDAWLAVDLGEERRIGRIRIVWENAYAKAFSVQVSGDGAAWRRVYTTTAGEGGITEITFAPVAARHVRIECTQRATQWGHAIHEFEVYE